MTTRSWPTYRRSTRNSRARSRPPRRACSTWRRTRSRPRIISGLTCENVRGDQAFEWGQKLGELTVRQWLAGLAGGSDAPESGVRSGPPFGVPMSLADKYARYRGTPRLCRGVPNVWGLGGHVGAPMFIGSADRAHRGAGRPRG